MGDTPVTCTFAVLYLGEDSSRDLNFPVLYIWEAAIPGRCAAPLYSVKAFPAGLEPATCGLEDHCSIQLSHGNKLSPVGVEPTLYGF
jgi:hypothetical protein